ncbi:MAG: hypothetical protein IJ822_04330 [Pyramidobacter sp.]|nr:hypothetical protein [Pyramidobacter sp.]MBQ8129433.1 hypothetical protein [Clostridia bacterium]MBR1895987.1 hypothetical protein [Pyramidobacter sp.]
MTDRPVYITVMKWPDVYVPVCMRITRMSKGYMLAFKLVNGLASKIYIFHYSGEQVYATADEAQAALDEMARAHGWAPYRRLERR